MKLTTFIILVFSLHISASGLSQNVTISVKNVSIQKVLKQISRQTGLSIIYNESYFDDIGSVSISVDNTPLDQVLDMCLGKDNYSYQVKDNMVFINKNTVRPVQKQPIVVTGKVTDKSKNPLSGVTVLIKGTLNGTTTDTDGRFTIEVPEDSILVFSYIGMQKQEIIITAGKQEIDVIMQDDVSELGEVSVISTGYQKIKPEQSTGSISTIQASEFDTRVNTTDFLAGLQNKIPGLLINNDIDFEENSLFQIRGISTINGSKEPLIVIDGFPTELSLNMINPNEIESVTVLKDAAAATVYGVRASNGVIVVERKKAKAGEPVVNFRATVGLTPKENYDRYRWDKDGSNTYVDYYRTYNENYIPSYIYSLMEDPSIGAYYNYPAPGLIMAQQSASVITEEEAKQQFKELGSYNNANDYARLFLRTATTQTYNLNISGGSENVLYYLTANYTDHDASEIKTGNNSFMLSGRSTMKLSKRFSLDLTTDYREIKTSSVPVPDIEDIYPYERFEDEDGIPLSLYTGSYANPYYNDYLISIGLFDNLYYPLVDINEISDKTHTVNNRITANFHYNIGKGFDLNFGGVYESSRKDTRHLASENSSEVHQYMNYYAEDDGSGGFIFNIPEGSLLKQQAATTESYTIRAQLNYNRQISKDHSLNFILGGEVRDVLDKSNTASYFGYNDQTLAQQAVDYYTILNSYSATYALSNVSLLYDDLFGQEYTDNRYISAYSNVVYSYKEKYSFSGSMRIDQSNLFGTDSKYKYKPLWSVGAAWNINKEDFLQYAEWVNSLKLRTAYGFNGNVAKNAIPRVIAASDKNYYYPTATSVLSLSSYANSGLRWEQTRNLNLGLDYTIFKNISGSIDVYSKKSKDVLASNQIDATKGGSYSTVNQASIRNNGLELNLQADWITHKNFNWNTGLVFSHNTSKVLDVYNSKINGTDKAYYYLYGSYTDYLEGYAVGALFNLRYAGIDNQGQMLIYDENGEKKVYTTSGIDKGDISYAGSSIPTVNIGLSNRVDIGNFYVYCMLNFYGGFKVRVPAPDPSETRPLKGASNYWKEAGDEEDPDVLPSLTYYYSSALTYTDKYTVNGAYMTLGDLTASYSFRNSKLVQKTGISNFELKAQASNLFTVGFNKYNYSVATGSYAKSYLAPTYTVGLYIYF